MTISSDTKLFKNIDNELQKKKDRSSRELIGSINNISDYLDVIEKRTSKLPSNIIMKVGVLTNAIIDYNQMLDLNYRQDLFDFYDKIRVSIKIKVEGIIQNRTVPVEKSFIELISNIDELFDDALNLKNG